MQQPKSTAKTIPNSEQFSKELIQNWKKIVCLCIGNENIPLTACTTTMRVRKSDIVNVLKYDPNDLEILIDDLCKKSYLARIGSNIKLGKDAINEFMEINTKKPQVQTSLPMIEPEITDQKKEVQKQEPTKNPPEKVKVKQSSITTEDEATLKLLKNRKKSTAKKPPVTEKPSKIEKVPAKPVESKTTEPKIVETKKPSKNESIVESNTKNLQERIIEVTRSESFMKMIQVAEEAAANFVGKEMKIKNILEECKKRMPEFSDVFFIEFFHLSPLPEVMKMEPESWKRK